MFNDFVDSHALPSINSLL